MPVWLVPFWTPRLISIGRCNRCLRVYRKNVNLWGRGPVSPCDTCPGQVIQWKRCARCRRWKPESSYHRIRDGRWLYYACRFCNCRAVAATRAARRATDPAWAEANRKAHRDYLVRRKKQAAP
jgi:hypothetical protein